MAHVYAEFLWVMNGTIINKANFLKKMHQFFPLLDRFQPPNIYLEDIKCFAQDAYKVVTFQLQEKETETESKELAWRILTEDTGDI